jgi:hypothetical protein
MLVLMVPDEDDPGGAPMTTLLNGAAPASLVFNSFET